MSFIQRSEINIPRQAPHVSSYKGRHAVAVSVRFGMHSHTGAWKRQKY